MQSGVSQAPVDDQQTSARSNIDQGQTGCTEQNRLIRVAFLIDKWEVDVSRGVGTF